MFPQPPQRLKIIDKDKESIGDKGSAWKNDRPEKKEFLSPLCNK